MTTKEYYAANSEKLKAESKKWRETHKEQEASRKKEYYKTHKEQEAAKKKEYREAHKEEEAARLKKYREAHKEQEAARRKKYREDHREKDEAWKRKYYETHKKQISAWKRKYDLKMKYGIDSNQYENLLIIQEHKCAICGTHCQNNKLFHIDHDHKTKTVRGLLCARCNLGIGLFHDDVKLLKDVIQYLEQYQEAIA